MSNTPPAGLFTVSRTEFIAWTEGELLNFENGKGIAPDELACEEAKRLLDAGETIGLTVNGRLFSTMKKTDTSYDEVAVPK